MELSRCLPIFHHLTTWQLLYLGIGASVAITRLFTMTHFKINEMRFRELKYVVWGIGLMYALIFADCFYFGTMQKMLHRYPDLTLVFSGYFWGYFLGLILFWIWTRVLCKK